MLSPTPGTTEHTWVPGQVQKPRLGRTRSCPGQVHLLMRDRRGAWPRAGIVRGAVLPSRARVAVTPPCPGGVEGGSLGGCQWARSGAVFRVRGREPASRILHTGHSARWGAEAGVRPGRWGEAGEMDGAPEERPVSGGHWGWALVLNSGATRAACLFEVVQLLPHPSRRDFALAGPSTDSPS